MKERILFPEATDQELKRIKSIMSAVDSTSSKDATAQNVRLAAHPDPISQDVNEAFPFQQATERMLFPYTLATQKYIYSAGVAKSPDKLWSQIESSIFKLAHVSLIRSQTQFMRDHRDRLTAATSEARYSQFANWLATDNGLNEYIGEYQVSYLNAVHQIQSLCAQTEEMLKRFNADRAHLGEIGITASSNLKEIQFSSGDLHNGRSVSFLVFDDNTRIVYKPRSVRSAVSYYKLVTAINNRFGLSLGAARVYAGSGYGWEEFIETSPSCDIKESYVKIGELLGLMHLLNATDMHFENIVMHKGIPFPIDLETLLSVITPRELDSVTTGGLALDRSVIYIGILPGLLQNHLKNRTEMDEGLNVGVVGYTAGQSSPFSQLVLKRSFTDEMHFSLEYLPQQRPETIPEIAPDRQSRYIRRGYSRFMNWVLDDKGWFLNIVEKLFAQINIRLVVLDTQRYSAALRLSTNPELQKRTEDRDLALCRVCLFRSNTPKEVLISEQQQLREGNVPIFYLASNSTNLYDPRGLLQTDALLISPLEEVIAKIRSIDPTSIAFNEWLIQLSFASQLSKVSESTDFVFPCGKTKAVQESLNTETLANQYIRDLCMTCVNVSEEHSAPDWIGGITSNTAFQYWVPGVLSSDLYSGAAGIAYILFCAGQHYGIPSAENLALRYFGATCHNLAESNEEQWLHQRHGALGGVESVIWAANEIANLRGDQDTVRLCQQLWRTARCSTVSNSQDVIRGNAGVLLARCSQLGNDPDERLRDDTRNIANTLMKAVEKSLLNDDFKYSGFAHGLAGQYAALAQWAVIDQNSKAEQLVSDLIERGERFINADGTIRIGKEEAQEGRGWCNGLPGILLAEAIAFRDIKNSPALLPIIEMQIPQVKQNCFGGNHTLCHGDLGNLWILDDVATLTTDHNLKRDVLNASRVYISEYLSKALNQVNRHTVSQSLMAGTSGALAFILHCSNPKIVRSPLWFGE